MFDAFKLVRGMALGLALVALPVQSVRADAPPATQPDADFPVIASPQIPDKTFNINDYGAVADGKTLSTDAIQKAIDACGKAGGGTVIVPAGSYLTGPIHLISNLNFKIDDGATLLITDDPKNFKLGDDPMGKTNGRYENCISAADCHDLEISGNGTIDGQGKAWWDSFRPWKGNEKAPGAPPHRPHLIVIQRCQRLLVSGVHLQNSPMFHFIPEACQDVTIDGITINSPALAPNTDGIDPSGINFHITNCKIDNGDDNIALKPVIIAVPDHPSCENFLVENCTFIHGHGMSIGGQSNGGLKHLVVRNCTFDSGDQGIRLKTPRGDGGLVEDCLYENCTMKNVKVAVQITSFYPKIPKKPDADPAQPVGPKTPIWKNIRITNLTATGSTTAGQIVGLPEMHVQDVLFTNVNISADKPFLIANADNVKFDNCQITVANEGPALTTAAATVTGIDLTSGK